MPDPVDPDHIDGVDPAAMEDYVGRCVAVIVGLTGELPAEDLSWAMHLVEHGEAPEGMCSLAWSLTKADHPSINQLVPRLRELMGGMVPDEALPEPFRSWN